MSVVHRPIYLILALGVPLSPAPDVLVPKTVGSIFLTLLLEIQK